MAEIEVIKLNESYSVIDADKKSIKDMFEFLRVERPGAWFEPMVKAGFKSPYEYFGSIQQEKLLVMNGHLQLLKSFGIDNNIVRLTPEYSHEELDEFTNEVFKVLPFKPYDYQLKAFYDSIIEHKQINRMCTGSGKSLTISLIAEFMRRQGKKGLLLVPNINLLTQFKNDIKDYNLIELYDDTHTIGGGQTDKHFNCSLTISTWQSMLQFKDRLNELDYVITDEAHRFASTETSAIVQETVNCKYKWGFTGTLPEDPIQKMQLFGLFGLPKTYITSSKLIEMGLATPIKINSIMFNYSSNDKGIFKEIGKLYAKQLKFLKDHEKRNEFITNLTCKIKDSGNTLVLGQHVEHLKLMYLSVMEKLYPEVKNIDNKQITGKDSFVFQEKYGVYYISGSDDSKTRELTRKILEEDLYAITLDDDTVIRLHGNKEVPLKCGKIKQVKHLLEDDEIDDVFINNIIRDI